MTNVTIQVRNVGQSMGHDAVLRSAKTGRVMRVRIGGKTVEAATNVAPHGMPHVARQRAEEMAKLHGWTIVSADQE